MDELQQNTNYEVEAQIKKLWEAPTLNCLDLEDTMGSPGSASDEGFAGIPTV